MARLYGIDGDEEDYQNMARIHHWIRYRVGAWAWEAKRQENTGQRGTSWIESWTTMRSVYLIQGMHDWNVDPHMAVPTINMLKDRGIGLRAYLDSNHYHPDRTIQLYERSDLGGRGEKLSRND